MSKSLELRQKRAKIVEEMHDLTSKTSFPAEAEARWSDLDKEQRALESQITKIESTEKLAEEMRQFTPPPANQVGETRSDEQKKEELRAKAFNAYLRGGWSAIERNAELRVYTPLTTTTGAQGGFEVPTGFQKELEVKLKAFGGMRSVARILNTSIGNTINWPTMDDTANSGRWLSENSAVSQTNPAFGQVNLVSNLASSDQVLLSIQLLNDSAFDMQGELTDAFSIRLARLTNAAYTNGTGSGQPTGIMNVAGIGSVAGVGDPQTGNTATNSIGVDDLVNVQAAVDAAYRKNGTYQFSDSTFNKLRKLKDSLGHPLWQVDLAAGVPDKILNRPYVVNFDMPNIGAGNKPVVYGDFSKYIIRDVGALEVVRYNELYMPNHQIGFQAYLRTDGQCIQPAAFAVIQQ